VRAARFLGECGRRAPKCTIGADSDARGTLCGVPAVRIEEAIKALQEGDVETARRLLRSDGGANRATVLVEDDLAESVTAPAANKDVPGSCPDGS
jgi:hypothetical protein